MASKAPRITSSNVPRIDVEAESGNKKKWIAAFGVGLLLLLGVVGIAVWTRTRGSKAVQASVDSISDASGAQGPQAAQAAQAPAAPKKTDAGTPEALRTYFALENASCAPDGIAWPQWTGPSDYIIGVPEELQALYSTITDGSYNASSQEYTLGFNGLPQNLTYCSKPVTVSPECHEPKAATGTLAECGTMNGTEMWTHNHGTKLCEPFTFNGCGGNANIFATQAVCARACESPVKATIGGTVTFTNNGTCAFPPTKADGSACCRMKLWQPNYAGYYYDDCSAMLEIGGDGVFFFKTEIPGSELSAGWGPDPMPHIHYDILCKDCIANEYFIGEYRNWNKFYPQEICEIPSCWGEGSTSGAFPQMAATSVHKAQMEEVVNDELRFTYHVTVPPENSNITRVGRPTEF